MQSAILTDLRHPFKWHMDWTGMSDENEMHVHLMKKIDILNFITNFRKAPNDIKTLNQILGHLGTEHEPAISQMLEELKQARVVREVELQGEKAFQVVSR